MSYKASAADRRTAEDSQTDQALMCAAHGCPSRWSVDGPMGRCCSAHAWGDRHLWPRITQELAEAAMQRAYEAAQRQGRDEAQPSRRTRTATPAERQRIAAVLAGMARKTGGLHWAKRLLLREEAGEPLTQSQREMWRCALRVPNAMAADAAKALLIEHKQAA